MCPRGMTLSGLTGVIVGVAGLFDGCSDPVDRSRLQAATDADYSIRAISVEVEVRLEKQDRNGGGWLTLAERRFTPRDPSAWPLRLSATTEAEIRGYYQLTSTARDNKGAIVARARTIRDLGKPGTPPLLRTLLEASCLRRICEEMSTCHDGDCVDADSLEQDQAADERGSIAAAQAASQPDAGSEPGQVAPECVGRSADEVFCDGDTMRACPNHVSSEPRSCGEHQRCVDTAGDVRCACELGFVPDVTGCRTPTECGADHGGCDSSTECHLINGKVSCGACPPGYSGDGISGCRPRLTALEVVGATLTPAFSPDLSEYRVELPIVALQAVVRASGPTGTHVQVDTHPVATGEAWVSPVLPLGDTTLELSVVSAAGVRSTYSIAVHRAGSEVAYLKAGSPSESDLMGTAIDLDGDTLVVATYLDDSSATRIDGDEANDDARDTGAAYVYVRNGGGWTRQAYLKASDAMPNDRMGGQAAISGDTLVLGALSADASGISSIAPRPGHARVFVRSGGMWKEQAKLSPKDGTAADWFGYGVSIEGDTIVVGAPHFGGRADSGGTAYVFTRTGETWTEVSTVRPRNPVASSMFGSNVAIRGDTLLVAAEQEASGQGAVYVFARNAGGWMELQRLAADEPADSKNFGYGMALRGGTLAVGAPGAAESSLFSAAGSVYLFERSAGEFRPNGVLHATVPRTSDYFGCSVCLTDRTLVVGASGDDSGGRGVAADPARGGGDLSGAAYLFTRDASGWTSPTFLKSSNSDPRDGFGFGVSCSETGVAVSAPFESSRASGLGGDGSDNSRLNSGAFYLFE